jgi:membrane protein YqaA with SNARE-associated domain
VKLLVVWLTTFAVCAISGPLPVVHSELYLFSVSTISPPAWAPGLILAAVLGQLVGKALLYFVGRGAIKIRSERFNRILLKAQSKMQANPKTGGAILFTSATLGLPPMYATTLACGAARMNFAWFLTLTAAGRIVRGGADELRLVPDPDRRRTDRPLLDRGVRSADREDVAAPGLTGITPPSIAPWLSRLLEGVRDGPSGAGPLP